MYRSFIFLSLILVISCTKEEKGCENDSQCKGDRICVKNQCVDPLKSSEADASVSASLEGDAVASVGGVSVSTANGISSVGAIVSTEDVQDSGGTASIQNTEIIKENDAFGVESASISDVPSEAVVGDVSAVEDAVSVSSPAPMSAEELVTNVSNQYIKLIEAIVSEKGDCSKMHKKAFEYIVGAPIVLQMKDLTTQFDEQQQKAIGFFINKMGKDFESFQEVCPGIHVYSACLNAKIFDDEWSKAEGLCKDFMLKAQPLPEPPPLSAEEVTVAKDQLKKMKIKTNFEMGDVKVKIIQSKIAKNWPADRYDSSWFDIEADKTSQWVYFDIEITSTSKNPKIPGFSAWTIKDDKIEKTTGLSVGMIRFYRWESYGSYLGNYHDSNNDFENRDTIKFTIGFEISKEALKNDIIFIGAFDTPCAIRKEKRNDPPKYDILPCVEEIFMVQKNIKILIDRYVPVYFVNQKKL